MQVTVMRNEIVQCLDRLQAVASKRAISPITGAVHIEARADGTIALSVSDFSSFVCEVIRGDVLEPGRVLTPLWRLFDVARKFTRMERIAISLEELAKSQGSDDGVTTNDVTVTTAKTSDEQSHHVLRISSGRTLFSLVTLAEIDSFPFPPDVKDAAQSSSDTQSSSNTASVSDSQRTAASDIADTSGATTTETTMDDESDSHITIEQAKLRHLFNTTIFAASTDPTREYLNGVFIDLKHEISHMPCALRAVATDGHRMALSDILLPVKKTLNNGIIIPRLAVQQILQIFAASDDDCALEITVKAQSLRVTSATIDFRCRTLGENFPDYQRVIPQDSPSQLVMNRSVLSTVIDRVSTVSDRNTRMIRFDIAHETLTLKSQTEIGENATEDLVVTYAGSPVAIGFNADYLMETLKRITHKYVLFEFRDTSSPVMISGLHEETDDVGHGGIIMEPEQKRSASEAADGTAQKGDIKAAESDPKSEPEHRDHSDSHSDSDSRSDSDSDPHSLQAESPNNNAPNSDKSHGDANTNTHEQHSHNDTDPTTQESSLGNAAGTGTGTGERVASCSRYVVMPMRL